MIKQSLLILAFFMLSSIAWADVPGKREMKSCTIRIQGIATFNDYRFYYVNNYGEEKNLFRTDTNLIIPGSGGAPFSLFVWAINNKSNKSTDTLVFDNYYSPNKVVTIRKIENDSIKLEESEFSNDNKIVETVNDQEIVNKDIATEAKKAEKKQSVTIFIFGAIGIIALGGIAWLYMRLKKNKQKTI